MTTSDILNGDSRTPVTAPDWKSVLPHLKGRTITGYATTAFGDGLTSLLISLDDGSWFTFDASEPWDGSHIKIERRVPE